MMKLNTFFTLLIMSFLSTSIHSSESNYVVKDSIESIFFHIYNQEFKLAEKELETNKDSLEYFTNNWLQIDLLWWKAISKNNQNSLNELQSFLEKKLRLINDESGEDKLMKTVYINYLMRIAAIKKQNFRVLKYFFQINKFYKKFDSSLLNPFQKDLYNIFQSVFKISKNNYIPFKKDNEDSHFKTLNNYTNSNNIIIKTMAQYFLIKIYTDVKKTPKLAKGHTEALCLQYPNNTIFLKILKN